METEDIERAKEYIEGLNHNEREVLKTALEMEMMRITGEDSTKPEEYRALGNKMWQALKDGENG